MTLVLPFRLKVPGKDEFEGVSAVSTTFRVHGFLRFDGYMLSVEWGGEIAIEEVGITKISDTTEPLQDERIDLPIADIHRASLTGGWFRPRLELQARRLGALSYIPSEKLGVVKFWYDRSERFAAIEMVNALNDAIASGGNRPLIDDSAITPI